MTRSINTLILFLLFVSSAFAKGKVTPHRGEVKGSYDFWLYEPPTIDEVASNVLSSIISSDTPPTNPTDLLDSESYKRYATEEYVPDEEVEEDFGEYVHADTKNGKPVVIFLHGASLCGKDLDRVRRYGTIHAIESGRDMDAYVIAPQNPGGSWSPSKIMALVDWLAQQREDVDLDRVYVLGMSLGGFGTIDLAATYPDRIAAAIGICGGASVSNLEGLDEVPLWIIHGTADKAVPISQSDKVANAIKSTDPDTPRLIYDRVPGMNHSQPARILYKPETYEWLFAHRLSDNGRPVAKSFDVSVSSLSNAYKGLNIKKTSYSGKKKSTSGKRISTKRKSKSRNKSTRKRK